MEMHIRVDNYKCETVFQFTFVRNTYSKNESQPLVSKVLHCATVIEYVCIVSPSSNISWVSLGQEHAIYNVLHAGSFEDLLPRNISNQVKNGVACR